MGVVASMSGLLSAGDWFLFLFLAGVYVFLFGLVALERVGSPSQNRQLSYLAEKSGIGRGLGALLVVVSFVTIFSAFVLGSPTGRRSDLALAAGLVAHVAGLFLVGVGLAAFRRHRALSGATSAATGDVSSGMVAVTGAALQHEECTAAPFSGDDALCFQCWVKERDLREDAPDVQAESIGIESNWEIEYSESFQTPFAVDDGSGSVIVDPTAMDLQLDETTTVTVEFPDDPPESVLSFVEDHLDTVGYAANDRRYEEAVLVPGDTVTVAGTVREAPDTGGRPTITGETGTAVVATGSLDRVRAETRRRMTAGIGGGIALSVAGYTGMLVVLGTI